jgi:nucleoside-diphosphate-sugar epimerase
MKKIMVVGGNGYLGARIVPEFERRGYEVEVVDLNWFAPKLSVLETARIDRNAALLTQADLVGIDTMIFLAGLSNDPMSDFDPMQNFVANAATPAYLAEISRGAGVKTFIHGGSCSVYGMAGNANFVNEETRPATFSPYGVSKLMGEVGIFQQANHMRCVAFRMGTVAGWSPRMRFDLVVNAMTKSALITNEIIVNDAKAQRPILDIADAVNAYIHAVEDDNVNGIINIASENTTVGEIAMSVASVVKRAAKVSASIHFTHAKEIRSYSASTVKARSQGFQFTGNVRRAAAEVVMHFGSIMNPDDDVYYNIRTFKALTESRMPAQRIAV